MGLLASRLAWGKRQQAARSLGGAPIRTVALDHDETMGGASRFSLAAHGLAELGLSVPGGGFALFIGGPLARRRDVGGGPEGGFDQAGL